MAKRHLTLFLILSSFAIASRHEFPEAGVDFEIPNDSWHETMDNRKGPIPVVVVKAGFASKNGATIGIVSSRPFAEMKLNFPSFVEGIKDGFAKPGATLRREEKLTFSGHSAVRLIGAVASPKGPIALNILTYMVGDIAWTISCSAPADNPAALAETLSFVRERL